MSQWIDSILAIQCLLSLSLVMIFGLLRFEIGISSLAKLQISYVLVLASFGLPFLVTLSPVENPFGSLIRVWGEPPAEVGRLHQLGSISLRVIETKANPSLAMDLEAFVFLILGLMVLCFWIVRLRKSYQSVIQLKTCLSQGVLSKQIGRVRVWLHDEVSSPFSVFTGYLNIVLPTAAIISPRTVRMIAAHEIQHHRQGDTIWVYAFEFFKLVLGFNPLVIRLIEEIEELQEFACDEVLVGQKQFSPQEYGSCLYDYAEKDHYHSHRHSFGAVGMAMRANQLKRRIIKMFQHQRVSSKLKSALILGVGVLTLSASAWSMRGAISNQKISMKEATRLAVKTSESQEIPVVMNKSVLKWLNKALSTKESREYVRKSLQRMEIYKPMISKRLGEASLPFELLAVPLIESGYKNSALSPAYAAGIWQFIPETARYCGLKVNDQVDERYQADKLTEAAVCYYTKLYAIFQNWHVALSAYNVGERRMMNAIREANHNDAFRIAESGVLGREGRNYLPKAMAAMILMKNPDLVK